ncbi:Glycoprotein-N-acetylgalactosamine 3-beta-galactosyltransferase [Bertholletia excelsa]
MKSPSDTAIVSANQSRSLPKFMGWLILFVFLTYVVYTMKLVSSSHACTQKSVLPAAHNRRNLRNITSGSPPFQNRTARILPRLVRPVETYRTELKDIVFGIASSARVWEHRKNYIKLWWRPKEMRGTVWLDSPVPTQPDEGLPQVRVSGNVAPFTRPGGDPLPVRISRIVSESYRLGMRNVRWFVMGDDDTFFVTENLLRVLSKYNHNEFYYIGGQSESHLQNIFFSYNMAFGGGGFAISYPLARALEAMQDKCLKRYTFLLASDDRIQACMAELGTPLTKELGFHQYDLWGNIFGLLAAHPVAPLVTMHHLDLIDPIFPNLTRFEALQRLQLAISLDSAAIVQQSICYDSDRKWTISVAWGFAVQVFRGVLSPREIEMPSRTFLNWYKRTEFHSYAFNTRPVSRNPCQNPFVFYMSTARMDSEIDQTVTEYSPFRESHPFCKWKMPDPAELELVEVYKRPNPYLWARSPRRNCCRVLSSSNKTSLALHVGLCREGEVSEI